MENNNRSLIDGLREAADFLESKPELPHFYGPFHLGVHISDREEFAAAVKMLGETEATFSGSYFLITKAFGPDVRVQIQTDREARSRPVPDVRPGDEALLKLVGMAVAE